MITYACLSIIAINLLIGLLDFWASYEIYGLISFSALTVLLINKKGYYQCRQVDFYSGSLSAGYFTVCYRSITHTSWFALPSGLCSKCDIIF
jgi:hypothetical protein